jgi:HlyD family secretion protein
VRRVEPSAFTELSSLGVKEQRVNALIDLDTPYASWSALMDGFRVEARIIVATAENVPKVPESALFRDDDRWALFAIEAERAVLRPVELGKRNGIEAEVLSGVDVGASVIVHPSDAVEAGVRVRR